MKKWQIIAPVGAVCAGAAAYILFSKKNDKKPAAEAKSAPAKKPVRNAAKGVYSFVSGYKDAATVDAEITYDADRFSFAVIEEEFLSYSSDSHVAVLYGEDFSIQLEYAAYYHGESFEALANHVQEKFKGFGSVSYGENKGVKYIDGDNMCICLPADENSYLLVTLVKAKDNDDDYTTLPDNEDVCALLSTLHFGVRK